MRNARRGFTLIEMIAVLTLLLIVGALAVSSFQSVVSDSRQNTVNLAARGVAHDLDAYAATTAVAPADLGAGYTTVAADFPADVTVTDNGDGTVTVTQGTGTNQRCATITLANTLGGTSTVATAECAVAPTVAWASNFTAENNSVTFTDDSYGSTTITVYSSLTQAEIDASPYLTNKQANGWLTTDALVLKVTAACVHYEAVAADWGSRYSMAAFLSADFLGAAGGCGTGGETFVLVGTGASANDVYVYLAVVADENSGISWSQLQRTVVAHRNA